MGSAQSTTDYIKELDRINAERATSTTTHPHPHRNFTTTQTSLSTTSRWSPERSIWINPATASHLSISTGHHLAPDCHPSWPSSCPSHLSPVVATSGDGVTELIRTIVSGAYKHVISTPRTQSGAIHQHLLTRPLMSLHYRSGLQPC